MLSPYVRSVNYAAEGLWHAVTTERNLKLFALGVVVSFALATIFQLDPADWIIILVAGGMFIATELLNTSLERLSSAFYRHIEEAKDTHKHRPAMKHTKDVAAAAALVMAVTWAAVVLIVLWPYVFEWVARLAHHLAR